MNIEEQIEYQIYRIEITDTENLEAKRWSPENDKPERIAERLSKTQKPLLGISMFTLVLHLLSLGVNAFINNNIQDFSYILPTLGGFTLSLINLISIQSESFKKLLFSRSLCWIKNIIHTINNWHGVLRYL